MANSSVSKIIVVTNQANHSSTKTITSNQNEQMLNDDRTKEIFYWVIFTMVGGSVSLLGIVTNAINMAVFVSLGFKDTINISLFALAVSDLLSLIAYLWMAIGHNPEFNVSVVPFFPLQVVYLTGGWPRVVFVRASGYIIAFVALERFLCIVRPHTAKATLTPTRVKVVIVAIFVIVVASVAPIYYTTRLQWKFFPKMNRSLLGLVFTENREALDSITMLMSNVIPIALTWTGLAIFTAAIVIKLKQKAKVRKAMANKEEDSTEATSKDIKLARMMVAVAAIFMLCLTPWVIIIFMIVSVSEDDNDLPIGNTVTLAMAFCYFLEGVNSSVNVFVYYKMNSRFKAKFDKMWTCF